MSLMRLVIILSCLTLHISFKSIDTDCNCRIVYSDIDGSPIETDSEILAIYYRSLRWVAVGIVVAGYYQMLQDWLYHHEYNYVT